MNEVDILIVGAGPAGLTAAAFAASTGASVLLLEGQSSAGQKLLLSGGGRCNFAHTRNQNDQSDHYYDKSRFVEHSLRDFGPAELSALLRKRSVPVMSDASGRLFPLSEKAADVLGALLYEAEFYGAEIRYRSKVERIERGSRSFRIHAETENFKARKLILCNGGMSLPQTGSDGSGLILLDQLEVPTIPFEAALCALNLAENCSDLEGISLNHARLSCVFGKHTVSQEASLLFTAKGLSGPCAHNMAYYVPEKSTEAFPMILSVCPDRKLEDLESDLLKLIRNESKTQLKNLPQSLIPQRLFIHFLKKCDLDPGLQAAHCKLSLIRRLAQELVRTSILIRGKTDAAYAMLSKGGADTKYFDPRKLESKTVPGLYCAGELLDYCGESGGYNILAACATGRLAAISAAEALGFDSKH